MADEMEENKIFFLTPSLIPNIATFIITLSAVWSLLLLILTATGSILDGQNFECWDIDNKTFVASRLTSEARLMYIWSGLSLLFCLLLLLEIWRKSGFCATVIVATTTVLFVVMISTFMISRKEEAQEIEELENRYMKLIPLRNIQSNPQNGSTDTSCHELINVYHWQAKLKCCGLQGYQDWKPSIPDSCLCEGGDNSAGCVGVGDSLVYEKPCLPIVLSTAKKRSTTFWIILMFCMSCAAVPILLYGLCFLGCFGYCCYVVFIEDCCDLSFWIYKLRGGEEMFTVVFIRKNNNNQTEGGMEHNREAEERSRVENDVALDVEDATNVEKEEKDAIDKDWKDNPVRRIPLSVLRKLQEELDPPPVLHLVQCLCIIQKHPEKFYTILIDEGSPLLPEGAVLVDFDKPTREGLWSDGPNVFEVSHLVWSKHMKEETNIHGH